MVEKATEERESPNFIGFQCSQCQRLRYAAHVVATLEDTSSDDDDDDDDDDGDKSDDNDSDFVPVNKPTAHPRARNPPQPTCKLRYTSMCLLCAVEYVKSIISADLHLRY